MTTKDASNMSDGDEQWPSNRQIRSKQSNKHTYQRNRSFRHESKTSVSSTGSSSLSEAPELPSVQIQHRASVRNVMKVSTQASATMSQSFIPPVSKAPKDSRKYAKREQSSIGHEMDIVEDLDTGGESNGSIFELKRPVRERLTITLPPKTKVATPQRKKHVPANSKKRNKLRLPESNTPAEEGERVACTSNQEQRNSPPTFSNDIVAPSSLGRRRSASEAALTDERPTKRLKEIALPGMIEVQTGSCHNSKYKHTKRCTACIAKKTGEPCRFRDIRAFVVSNGVPAGPAIFHGIPEAPGHAAPTQPRFNEVWLSKPDRKDVQHIKTSAARIMLPILLEERKALKGRESQVIRRTREVEVRVTCGMSSVVASSDEANVDVWDVVDRCLTSVFSTSFICTDCGREFCLECFASLESMNGTTSLLHPKLVTCGMSRSGVTHDPGLFLPVSRLPITDLDDTILEMENLLGNRPESPPVPDINSLVFTALDSRAAIIEQAATKLRPLSDEVEQWKAELRNGLTPERPEIVIPATPVPLESLSTIPLDMPVIPSTSPLDTPDMSSALNSLTTPSSASTLTPLPESRMSPPPPPDVMGMPKDPTGITSLTFQTFHHTELSDEMFRLLWADGVTMVVTDLLPKMHIQWTPEYFINHYGENTCAITDCDTETVQQSTVQEFFEQFGNYLHRGGSILKLKDWPPTADFKNAFPALFDDFHRAVPAPNYTRRDGFYNFSAHFPTNAVVPDMGPKMYNAFKSREDGYGSTRLHMDMADAVNIMLYSTPLPGETIGYAVWDIYPSASSAVLRAFLKEEFPVEASQVQYVDPIHSQYFYLTPTLRTKLYEKYNVRSWRIYQKPGDAVFIPAGCAHQVCNLADCIKVAVDFVSPENLSRCGQLTKEFRSENEKVTWKEDILQLSNMCWSAWENTRQMEKSIASVKEAS